MMRALHLAFLALFLAAGCSAPHVRFTSTPSGAVVKLGRQEARTPCTLRIPAAGGTATLTSPTGGVRTWELAPPPSHWARSRQWAASVAGKSCKVVAVPFLAAGCLGMLVLSGDNEPNDYDRREGEWTVAAGSLGCLLVGVLFWGAGQVLDDPPPSTLAVHVRFAEEHSRTVAPSVTGTNKPPGKVLLPWSNMNKTTGTPTPSGRP